MRRWAAIALLCVLPGAPPVAAASVWAGSWGADPTAGSGPAISGRTVRQVIRLSLGGQALRIRVSNATGTATLAIGQARLARPGGAAGSIDPTTDRALTFGGRRSVSLAPGEEAVSDPAAMAAGALDRVDVSLFVADAGQVADVHSKGLETGFIADGDQAAAASLAGARTTSSRFLLTEVDARAADAGTVVAFGDSITDGYGSRRDADQRWPDRLAERLVAVGAKLGVVDAGIAGNRLLTDGSEARYGIAGQARFDRDVLSVPHVRTMILLEGINDIGGARATRDALVAGMVQLVARARAHGVRVLGATLTPFRGSVLPRYGSDAGEAVRRAVNAWIRTGRGFDGVVDFDAMIRDPARPDRLAAGFDSGDHLHPNGAGYRRMADGIDLRLLTEPARAR